MMTWEVSARRINSKSYRKEGTYRNKYDALKKQDELLKSHLPPGGNHIISVRVTAHIPWARSEGKQK